MLILYAYEIRGHIFVQRSQPTNQPANEFNSPYLLLLPLLHYSNLTFVLYSFFSKLFFRFFVCLSLFRPFSVHLFHIWILAKMRKKNIEQESNGEHETSEKQFFFIFASVCVYCTLMRMLSRSLKIYFVIQFSSHNRRGERISNKKKQHFSRYEWEKTNDDDLARARTRKKRNNVESNTTLRKKCKFRFEIEQSKNVPNLTGEKIEAH